MARFYLYYISIGIVGSFLGMRAIATVVSGEMSLPVTVVGFCGVGMVVAAAYEFATTDPEEFSVGRITFGVVVGGAVLALLGAGLLLIMII